MRPLAVLIEDEVDDALDVASLRLGRRKDDLVGDILRRYVDETGVPPGPAPAGERPIEAVLAELAAEVPLEEWTQLPPDLSGQVDHYLYGARKR